MFALIPIIGRGTREDPYRPDVPNEAAYSAHIPTDRQGVPRYLDTLVWFPERVIVPSSLTTRLRSLSGARDVMERREALLNVEAMACAPPGLSMRGATRTVLATESFDGSDSGDIGANWDAGYTGNTALQRVGNRCRATTVNQDALETYNAVAWPNDQWARIDIPTFTSTGIMAANVVLRCAAPPDKNFYLVQALRNFTDDSRVLKCIAGSFTNLATETATVWAGGDSLAGEMQGNVLRLYRNDGATPLLSALDSTFDEGLAGVLMFAELNLANVEVENWSAGALSPDGIARMARGTFPKPKLRHPMSTGRG